MAVPVRVTESTSFRGSRKPVVPKRRGMVSLVPPRPRSPHPSPGAQEEGQGSQNPEFKPKVSPGHGLPLVPSWFFLLMTGFYDSRSWPSTRCPVNRNAEVTCHSRPQLPTLTLLWSIDVVSEADPGPGQEAMLGGMGAAERPKGDGGRHSGEAHALSPRVWVIPHLCPTRLLRASPPNKPT